MARTKARLLARIGKARVYRARLEPSPLLKYLDYPALKRAPIVEIPVGSVTIPGRTVSIVAVARRGKVTEFRPANCPDCETARTSRKRNHKRVALARAVHDELSVSGGERRPFAMPVVGLQLPGTDIDIAIVLTSDGVICIRIGKGPYSCLFCTDGISCSRPSVPPIE